MSDARFSYRIVKLANGTHSLHSLAEAETFHPVVGPTVEAETLYVRQLRLPERASQVEGEFVIWDVGLGAAANPITFLRAALKVRTRSAWSVSITPWSRSGSRFRTRITCPTCGNLKPHWQPCFRLAGFLRPWRPPGGMGSVHVADFPSLLVPG